MSLLDKDSRPRHRTKSEWSALRRLIRHLIQLPIPWHFHRAPVARFASVSLLDNLAQQYTVSNGLATTVFVIIA